MKVLAVNSSLRGGGESKTELMLTQLVEGMREAGAEVKVVNLRSRKVEYCRGCYTCSTRTDGKCVIADDMTAELFPAWLEADLCVYATPLFHYTVSAPMKTFIERTWPVCEPFLLQEADGTWSHPLRHASPRAVVLSVAGFPEMPVFDTLSGYVRKLFSRSGLVAELYRPGAEMLPSLPRRLRADILDAARRAGCEIVRDGGVSPETLERVQQPIGNMEDFKDLANAFWRTCIEEGVNPRTFRKRGLVPRPDSLKTFARIMSLGFDLPEEDRTEAVLQFDFTGEREGSCHFIISRGEVTWAEGAAEAADLTIAAPFELWMDIMCGKTEGAQMFMQGRCTASGDYDLMRLFTREGG